MTLLKWARRLLRDFTVSTGGNVAMMFGIALVPLLIAAGVGLDYARSALVRSQMSDALDAASLAVGSTTGLDRAKAEALAQKYFAANYQGDTSNGTPQVTIGTNDYNSQGSVKITANYTMPTLLMKIAGVTNVPLTTSTTVVWGQTKLWVSLVLDNSGSMCEPASQPCNNTTNTNTKIYQLKSATKDMLTKLQAVSTTAGDVQVAIIPFNRAVDVGTGNVSASWIYWGYWEAEPANAALNNVTDLKGPGDSCPWSTGSQGYTCTDSALNSASNTSAIPSSGLLCPGIDSGKFNVDRNNNYYNGCYSSVATGATKDVSTGSNATCNGYANCSCSGSNSNKKCTAKYYKHTWTVNAHSTWGGCITDRAQSYDVSNTSPSGTNTTGFPADNPNAPVDASSCMYGEVMSLGYNWTNLTARVDAMQAKGATNQAIGVAHGWQMLTPGSPYGTPTVPANTTRYIILLSDGLNTRNRWWGDGSTENTTEDSYIDDRMDLACTAAKTDGVVIYTLYVHVNGGGNSQPLKDCATDTSKYYDLTSSTQIAAAFADITKQITNVRVSK